MRHLIGPLPVRIAWALLPLAVGPAVGEALDDRSRAVSLTGASLAWGVWALVLVAVLIPRTVSLTVLRVAAPAALATANWAAVAGQTTAVDMVGLAWAAVVVLVAFAPSTGDCYVNGSSYGDERRLPLRPPGALLFGPIELAWLVAVSVPVGVPLLVAANRWVAAGALAIIGLPGAVIATRALHGLSRRWVVFVPAGMVLHDHHAMVDPVLFLRSSIRRLGPAPADPDGVLDLTRDAFGLALEVDLVEPTDIAPRRRDRSVQTQRADRVLFSPTRPGAVLNEAARRHIAIGGPAAQAT